jgi:hypothetical protein
LASPSKYGNEIDPAAYITLISEHNIEQPLRVEPWMKDAQAALTALPRFRQEFASRLSESGPEVPIAVFFWIFRAIKVRNAKKSNQVPSPLILHARHKLSTLQHVSLVDKCGVSLKVFSRLAKTMEDECEELKESIRATIREMRKKKEKVNTTPTPMSTPSRLQSQSWSTSPTKSALHDVSKTPSLASGSVNRNVAFLSPMRPLQRRRWRLRTRDSFEAPSHNTMPRHLRSAHVAHAQGSTVVCVCLVRKRCRGRRDDRCAALATAFIDTDAAASRCV